MIDLISSFLTTFCAVIFFFSDMIHMIPGSGFSSESFVYLGVNIRLMKDIKDILRSHSGVRCEPRYAWTRRYVP